MKLFTRHERTTGVYGVMFIYSKCLFSRESHSFGLTSHSGSAVLEQKVRVTVILEGAFILYQSAGQISYINRTSTIKATPAPAVL